MSVLNHNSVFSISVLNNVLHVRLLIKCQHSQAAHMIYLKFTKVSQIFQTFAPLLTNQYDILKNSTISTIIITTANYK